MYNANNYGYNPYGRYMNQPMQQPIQPIEQPNMGVKMGLQGKQVESIDVVKAIDIPLDGSISYFPLADNTAILTKQLQTDGTSKINIYKLTQEKDISQPNYATLEDLDKKFKQIDLSDLEDDIKDLKNEIKKLKKKGD